jgi:xylose isomerase
MNNLKDYRSQSFRRSKDDLIKHMKEFDLELNVSVGIWYFAPGGSRFHERYVSEKSIAQSLEIAAEMAKYGVKGIEAHYPFEANEENLHLYKKCEKESGVKLISAGPWLFYSKDFEFGSLSNPIKSKRDKAIELLIQNLKFVRDNNLNHCGIWPGIDGYTYPLGNLYYEMWDNFEDSVAQAMDEVPGVRIAIEPKPYEPIPNNIYRTTSDGLLSVRDIEKRLKNPINKKILEDGHTLLGMQPEIGHIRMGFEDTPYSFMRITREARLYHTHWNSQPLGNYDQDLNIGVVEWQQAEAALYALKMIGYNGFFGIDINPERIPVLKAIEINCKALKIMNERINLLPHERIINSYYDPINNRGEIEMILAENMRPG